MSVGEKPWDVQRYPGSDRAKGTWWLNPWSRVKWWLQLADLLRKRWLCLWEARDGKRLKRLYGPCTELTIASVTESMLKRVTLQWVGWVPAVLLVLSSCVTLKEHSYFLKLTFFNADISILVSCKILYDNQMRKCIKKMVKTVKSNAN
jgi:hypothetical protein